jgi:tetratricopeptide (TPR) repeat protein
LDILETIKELDDTDQLIEEGDKQQELDTHENTVLDDHGKYKNAILCYDKAIRIDPKFPTPWLSKGLIFHKLKKYDEAITCYDKANDLLNYFSDSTYDMAYHEVWSSKGKIYDHWGKPDKAKQCYDKASFRHS